MSVFSENEFKNESENEIKNESKNESENRCIMLPEEIKMKECFIGLTESKLKKSSATAQPASVSFIGLTGSKLKKNDHRVSESDEK